MTLGERLLIARKHAGLSQLALAERSGVSQQTISNIENEIQDKSTDTVQLAVACGVRCEWLGMESGEMVEDRLYATTRIEKAALSLMQQIPEYAQSGALQSLDTIAQLTQEQKKSN